MNKQTVKDIDVTGRRVLVRVDFNVPLDINTGAILNDTRIRASAPTINYLVERKARVILCSHLGQPKQGFEKGLTLAPLAKRLAEIIHRPVGFVEDCVGSKVKAAVAALKEGDIVLLENLRFHPEEEKNDPSFSKALAGLADIYVNDAFSTSHRAHASMVGVTAYLPAVAGLLMERELATMGKALNQPIRPLAMVMGGAKVSDKIGLLENALGKVDILLIGGGIASTFLKARGTEVGSSLVETDKLEVARGIMERAKKNSVRLVLPTDVVTAEKIAAGGKTRVVSVNDVPSGWQIADVGPKTLDNFARELHKAKTVIWNGPMGVYEIAQFAGGTKAIARLLGSLDAITIVGGGSTADIVEELGLVNRMTHVSMGGGASLAFLEGKTLVGVTPLLEK
ncbi:MAG: phosphoglycerate kinase [Chloroflexi bacterium]|nr:phosphoglycerate kinase [Chloroflexota bacterium]